MRVLEIMGSLHRGGAETIVMNYYRSFDKKICQFDFVIHSRFDNDYCDEAISYGAKIIELPRPGSIGFFRYVNCLKKAIVENGPYDAVHIHTNSQAFMCVIASRLARINNVIVHSHSSRFSPITIPINRFVFFMGNVKRVGCGIVAGKALFGSARFDILNNAINTSNFYIDMKDGKKNNCSPFIIGHLGRLCEVKNQKFLIDVIKIVSKQCNIRLEIYGDGPLKENLKDYIHDLNLDGIVELKGITNKPYLMYHRFDLFVLPSLYEGFPVTLVETQMSGIKALAADTISKECDFSLGLIKYLPLDVDTWVHEIVDSSNNRDFRLDKKKLMEKSQEYDTEYQWKKLLEIYKR